MFGFDIREPEVSKWLIFLLRHCVRSVIDSTHMLKLLRATLQ